MSANYISCGLCQTKHLLGLVSGQSDGEDLMFQMEMGTQDGFNTSTRHTDLIKGNNDNIDGDCLTMIITVIMNVNIMNLLKILWQILYIMITK